MTDQQTAKHIFVSSPMKPKTDLERIADALERIAKAQLEAAREDGRAAAMRKIEKQLDECETCYMHRLVRETDDD